MQIGLSHVARSRELLSSSMMLKNLKRLYHISGDFSSCAYGLIFSAKQQEKTKKYFGTTEKTIYSKRKGVGKRLIIYL